MKTTLATIALLMALTSIVSAQANHHWAAEQLANRTQMARDKIGIQCQKLPSGLPRDECEISVYTSYYSLLDSIRKAEHSESDEALGFISRKIDEFEAQVAPLVQKLERQGK